MNEQQIDKAEQLLSYFELHGQSWPSTSASEWWLGEAVAMMRDGLPEWSAFKTADAR